MYPCASGCIYKSASRGSTCLCACFGMRLAPAGGTAGIGGGRSFLAVTQAGGCGQHHPHRLPARGPAQAASPKPLLGQLWSSPALQVRTARASVADGGCAGRRGLPQPSSHLCCTIRHPEVTSAASLLVLS